MGRDCSRAMRDDRVRLNGDRLFWGYERQKDSFTWGGIALGLREMTEELL